MTVDKITINVHKAEGTPRGDGWYWIANGHHDGRAIVDVGGDDWYPTRELARSAGRQFAHECVWSEQYGWTIKINVTKTAEGMPFTMDEGEFYAKLDEAVKRGETVLSFCTRMVKGYLRLEARVRELGSQVDEEQKSIDIAFAALIARNEEAAE